MTKGQVHEGIIRITDKGSVITWDFDVMRHDVVFTVYRLKHPLKTKSPSSTPSPTPTGLATFNYPKKRDSKDNSDTSDKEKVTPAPPSKEQSTGQQSSNRYVGHADFVLLQSLKLIWRLSDKKHHITLEKSEIYSHRKKKNRQIKYLFSIVVNSLV